MPQNDCRGGLLADEMGMGKTLAMLTLVVHTLDDANKFADGTRLAGSVEQISNGLVRRPLGATLIVAPKLSMASLLYSIGRC